MLSQELELTLNIAFASACQHRHEFMTIEHLLLVLLNNPSVKKVLEACTVDIMTMRHELEIFIEHTTPLFPATNKECNTQPTLGFQRVLQRAIFNVRTSGSKEVSGANVLIAIFSEQESQAAYLLKKHEVNPFDIANLVFPGKINNKLNSLCSDTKRFIKKKQVKMEKYIEKFTTNLNHLAHIDHIDPLIVRDKELERTIQVLCRRRKNNPLLVGESGVGKTAIAEGLAWRIVRNEIQEVMQKCIVYSLDIGALLSGTKYRGDFEKRFKILLKQMEFDKQSILFIDEIHTIIGTGSASGSQLDIANFIKPLLSSGKIRIIGSTTYQEFRNLFEKDRVLARRFQKIDILEPSLEETVQILNGLKSKYETHHNVRYTSKSLRAAVELAVKYINGRYLPDKAIDIIDEAGACSRLLPATRRRKIIHVSDIERVVAHIARVPQQSVSASDRDRLKNLSSRLKKLVFGQDKAIEALTEAIKVSRAGLRQEYKPVGSFLFAGPTGVGKTEVTVQLSKALDMKLLRFDMSEYMERHSISRLIGTSPGYIGFDNGGYLTDAIIKNPYSVLLLDEIEKAHPDIFNLMLQVMDYGILTDNNGRKADFRNVVLVMTTNAGAYEAERNSIGLVKQNCSVDTIAEIKKIFLPEFRNRFDSIIWFEHLSIEVIYQVVDKFIVELQSQLNKKGVFLQVSQNARSWLAEMGYDRTMGARPMSRIVQENLKQPLANELLFGSLVKGGSVSIDLDKNKNQLTYLF
ncbi:ATP-dependent Clp protease ATP-binding subunit ClpA [Candidatus Pantoea carbekii]|uniref:ClpA protein n=1 Tax=Candidatus Pantoea carbekii TaxID=1235990 RepID=U3U9S8_9GAMM|nr:ATP-dependent Clp protease ATP-binding subunit ClpA [Candidatus Pantoea carbekii]AKC32171.1 ATP-dependent Clp protease ATPbinding subunit ClpA [Candidatus Pantoea carbekii]BAO00698.1 ClpA protein [Candidatus Pantoea carbekii]